MSITFALKKKDCRKYLLLQGNTDKKRKPSFLWTCKKTSSESHKKYTSPGVASESSTWHRFPGHDRVSLWSLWNASSCIGQSC